MANNISIKLGLSVFTFCVIILAYAFVGKSGNVTIADGPVNWMSFEQAVEKTKTQPRPILVDVYTSWCGPCKMMSHNTFGNTKIAEYLNTHFYCVKFDAETFDTVKFTVNVPDSVPAKDGKTKTVVQTPRQMVFVNPAPKGTPRSPHQFAASILDGQLSYPSIVFLSPKVQRINIIKGYHQPNQFEPYMKYFGSGAWEKQQYKEYMKTFKPEFQ